MKYLKETGCEHGCKYCTKCNEVEQNCECKKDFRGSLGG